MLTEAGKIITDAELETAKKNVKPDYIAQYFFTSVSNYKL